MPSRSSGDCVTIPFPLKGGGVGDSQRTDPLLQKEQEEDRLQEAAPPRSWRASSQKPSARNTSLVCTFCADTSQSLVREPWREPGTATSNGEPTHQMPPAYAMGWIVTRGVSSLKDNVYLLVCVWWEGGFWIFWVFLLSVSGGFWKWRVFALIRCNWNSVADRHIWEKFLRELCLKI